MDDKVRVRTTHLTQYLSCPKAYKYGQLFDGSNSRYVPFIYGILGHYFLEHMSEMEPPQAFAQWCDENMDAGFTYIAKAGDLYDSVVGTLQHYKTFWEWKSRIGGHILADFDVIYREKKFQYPEASYTYTGTMDGIITLSDGGTYLLEHKFVKDIASYKLSIPSSLQPYAYLHYARKFYPDVRGILYDLVCKAPVSYPQPYKTKGKRAYKYKLNDGVNLTLPYLYEWADSLGEEPEDRLIAHVSSQEYEDARFNRFIFSPLDEKMDEFVGIIKRESLRFVHSHQTNTYEKRPTYWNCRNCHYKIACLGVR